jgi:nucleoside-diphosphate-sugar epimerase
VYPTRLFGPGILAESNAVSMMIDLYLRGKWRLILGNGEAGGNYVYVDDVANGMINAMKLSKNGERYILGGDNLSLNKFFSLITEKSGKKYMLFHVPEKLALMFSQFEEYRAKISNHYPLISPGWVKTFSLDWNFSSNKAINDINYKITPFEKALETTLAWLSSKERRF